MLSTLSFYGWSHLWVVNKIEGIKGHLNMSRTARLVVPNYICHITQKENYRQNIFQDDEDQLRYLSWIPVCQQAGMSIARNINSHYLPVV